MTITKLMEAIKPYDRIMVAYLSNTCPACHQMQPILAELKLPHIKIVSEEEQMLTMMSGVSALPTFVFYHNGLEYYRSTGVNHLQRLQEIYEMEIKTKKNKKK